MLFEMNRTEKCMVEMKILFIRKRDDLLTSKDVRKYMKGYTEPEIYNTLKFLYDTNFLNRKMMFHNSFYWLKI